MAVGAGAGTSIAETSPLDPARRRASQTIGAAQLRGDHPVRLRLGFHHRRRPSEHYRCRCALYVFFMLRELEGSLAMRSHVKLNRRELTLTWSLPVSKTDPEARGCTRTWGGICPSPTAPVTMCPYHTAEKHLRMIDEKFYGKVDEDYDDMPDCAMTMTTGSTSQGVRMISPYSRTSSGTQSRLLLWRT